MSLNNNPIYSKHHWGCSHVGRESPSMELLMESAWNGKVCAWGRWLCLSRTPQKIHTLQTWSLKIKYSDCCWTLHSLGVIGVTGAAALDLLQFREGLRGASSAPSCLLLTFLESQKGLGYKWTERPSHFSPLPRGLDNFHYTKLSLAPSTLALNMSNLCQCLITLTALLGRLY